jgi:amidase
VLLPVQAEGALLGLGDVHAVQGDGEVSGTGIEIEAEITVRVARGPRLSQRPCILRPTTVSTVASAPEWDDALRLACEDMVRLVCDRREMGYADARMLVSLAGNLRVSQMVNPWMTARMVMPRELVRC